MERSFRLDYLIKKYSKMFARRASSLIAFNGLTIEDIEDFLKLLKAYTNFDLDLLDILERYEKVFDYMKGNQLEKVILPDLGSYLVSDEELDLITDNLADVIMGREVIARGA